jgi:hypothetical protein
MSVWKEELTERSPKATGAIFPALTPKAAGCIYYYWPKPLLIIRYGLCGCYPGEK